MKVKQFKKLCEEDTRRHIIFLHTIGKIFLTDKQLDEILEKRDKDENRNKGTNSYRFN